MFFFVEMSFAMRSEGLVRRHNAPSTTTTVDDDQQEDERREQEEQEDTDYSKETRLTLMEEVLLLGLKDREVSCGCCVEYCNESA